MKQGKASAAPRRCRGSSTFEPGPVAGINAEDARKKGIQNGEIVRVTSSRGRIQAKARVNKKSPRGVVCMSFLFGEAAANMPTNPTLDPVAKIPEFKAAAVRIEKDGAND